MQRHQLAGPLVVLDDDHGGAWVAEGGIGGGGRVAGAAGRLSGDGEPERAAHAGCAGDPDPAAVQLHDPLGDRQAETGALGAGHEPAALLERVEDPLLVDVGDARRRCR